jgi:shikimate kinase / 3-dehydroquinate synthase
MTEPRNLIITGFMGTGKTTVAQRVAERIGRPFVDMDDVIVMRAGRTIPEIFAQFGENAFRQIERGLCEELSIRSGLVIATGGGCLVDASNRDLLMSNGLVICLDCEAERLVERLQGDRGRPMLWGDSPEQRVRDLLSQRWDAYHRIPHHIDTTNRTVEQVVDEVIWLYEADPEAWRVRTPTGNYGVHLIPGGLRMLGDLLKAQRVASDPVVVSDEHVWPLYGAKVMQSLEARGYKPASVVLPAGERHKTLDTVRSLYDQFIAAGLDRGGAVIALGGGVVTDTAGFAAATYLRGVRLVQVPTSLLGMIDASVGGKVAVDHPRGKNLIGAFVEPLLVLLDTDTLETLPEVERQAGLAEIIKAGVIADPELFAMLEPEATPPELRALIGRALQVKIDIVEEDPYEQGRRAVLNLGHTFAHAYEVLEGYDLHHGLAVSIGMVKAALLAELRGLCTSETRERIVAALRAHGLPVDAPDHDAETVYEAMHTDKKRRGGRLRFILPRTIGDVILVDGIPDEQVIEILRRPTP